MNTSAKATERGERASELYVSRMGMVHRAAWINTNSGTITLRDKRTFSLSDFRPYVPDIHGELSGLEVCSECGVKS